MLCDTSLLGLFLSYEESVVITTPGPKDIHTCQWRSIICQHNARWHHVSLLKASVFCSSQKNNTNVNKTHPPVPGMGTAILGVMEPHFAEPMMAK